MLQNKNFNIDWIDFPDKKNKRVSGVYMIGESLYIGASIHIRSRVLAHLNNVKNNRNVNGEIKKYVSECMDLKTPIKITFLSDNCFLEDVFQQKYMPERQKSQFERNYHQSYKKI